MVYFGIETVFQEVLKALQQKGSVAQECGRVDQYVRLHALWLEVDVQGGSSFSIRSGVLLVGEAEENRKDLYRSQVMSLSMGQMGRFICR